MNTDEYGVYLMMNGDVQKMTQLTESVGLEWPFSGDALTRLNAKGRDDDA